MFLLIISSLVSGNFTFASTEEGQFPQSIIAASSTDTTPHALELRAMQEGDNAEPRKVSQFKLDMTNVVTAQVNSQLLVFVTDSSVRVLEAKVRTVSGQLIDLVPSIQANAFSLANLPVGVYTLDVITQKGNVRAAYEGILVIGQQPTIVITETIRNVINQVINQNIRVDIDECPRGYVGEPPFCTKPPTPTPTPEPSICYFDPDNEACNPDEEGNCPSGFGFNEDGQCIPQGKCPDGYGRLDDDETGTCYPKRDIKTCPSGHITHKFATCPEDQPGPSPAPNETEANDPCNYYGLDVCTGSGEDRQCDSERFDCLSVCEDGTTRTTGQCPGDDEDRTTSGQDDNDTEGPIEPTPTEPTPTEPTPTEPTPESPTEREDSTTTEAEEDSGSVEDSGSDQESPPSSP